MKTLLIDINRCSGCYNCQLACKDEHVDNDWSPYAKPQPDLGQMWMNVLNLERGQYPKVKVAYVPKLCGHCQKPDCMKAAQGGAIYKRDDGIVIIDPEKSKGQRQIVDACPHRNIFWNEELNIPQKCTFCAHLLDEGWKVPRCVEACPTEALIFGEYEEIIKRAGNKKLDVMNPEAGTKPCVFYIGLPKRFIAGTLYYKERDECAENVIVTLIGSGLDRTVRTNNYGDFEFEGLESDQEFTVKIEHLGYAPETFTANTKNDVYLGEIYLHSIKAKKYKES